MKWWLETVRKYSLRWQHKHSCGRPQCAMTCFCEQWKNPALLQLRAPGLFYPHQRDAVSVRHFGCNQGIPNVCPDDEHYTWAPVQGFRPIWAITWVPNLHPHTCSHKYRGTQYPWVLCLPVKPHWGWGSRKGCQAGGGMSHLHLMHQTNDPARETMSQHNAVMGQATLWCTECHHPLLAPGFAQDYTLSAVANFSLSLKHRWLCNPWQGNKNPKFSNLHPHYRCMTWKGKIRKSLSSPQTSYSPPY